MKITIKIVENLLTPYEKILWINNSRKIRRVENSIAVNTSGTPILSKIPNQTKNIAINNPCLKLEDKWVVRTSPL